jgi:hypothetical protein
MTIKASDRTGVCREIHELIIIYDWNVARDAIGGENSLKLYTKRALRRIEISRPGDAREIACSRHGG